VYQATKANRLQTEVDKLRERLTDLEFTKSRIDELRTENHLLLETKQELEYQVAARDQRLTKTAELETELNRLKQIVRNISSVSHTDNRVRRCHSTYNHDDVCATIKVH
jgi:hypothetical protein